MVRSTLLAVTSPPSLPEMPSALPPAPAIQPTSSLLIAPRQHHFGDFGGGLVGHPQAIDELAFDPELLEHRADLRAAAVDHHRVDPDRFQQHHILGKIARQFGIAHRMAAVFDHESLAGIALEIGQRLDQRFGLGEHCGIVGSVMGRGFRVSALRRPACAKAAPRPR